MLSVFFSSFASEGQKRPEIAKTMPSIMQQNCTGIHMLRMLKKEFTKTDSIEYAYLPHRFFTT